MVLLHDFEALAAQLPAVGDALRDRGWRIACAESCTGGLIAALCTSVAGSSDWFERGFVTYSNEAKTEQLGVAAALIGTHGAVSQEVVLAMAQGALQHSRAQLALAVTGVAGPGGGSPDKPVGTVWLAWAWREAAEAGMSAQAQCFQLPGDRAAVRSATVAQALARLQQLLNPAAPAA
jgi:nicotinamide-nucleotide amidase